MKFTRLDHILFGGVTALIGAVAFFIVTITVIIGMSLVT